MLQGKARCSRQNKSLKDAAMWLVKLRKGLSVCLVPRTLRVLGSVPECLAEGGGPETEERRHLGWQYIEAGEIAAACIHRDNKITTCIFRNTG